MSVIFDLPDELCTEFLSEWIGTRALTVLDSALCSSQFRGELTKLFPSIRGNFKTHWNNKLFEWMERNGIAVTTLFLDSHDLTFFQQKYLLSCVKITALHISKYLFGFGDGILLINLTQLNMKMSNSIEFLMLVYKNCRCLKTIDVIGATATETQLLLEIIKLNSQLVSITLQANASILQELVLVCSHNIANIEILGEADIPSMLHLLRSSKSIDTICMTTCLGCCYISYSKSKRRLTLTNPVHTPGWRDFASEIPIHELVLHGHFDEDVEFPLVHTVQFDCFGYAESVLKRLLSRCSALTKLSFSCPRSLNWWEILSGSNQLQELSIQGPFDQVTFLLTACHHLKRVSLSGGRILLEKIPTVLAAIKNYRHITTNLSLRCTCDMYCGLNDDYLYHMEYDGREFSGDLIEDYPGLLEKCVREKDETNMSLKETIKEQIEIINALDASIDRLTPKLHRQQKVLREMKELMDWNEDFDDNRVSATETTGMYGN